MTRRRYQACKDRNQQMILPPSIDDYVSEDNLVRAIEGFVEVLDLKALGFTNTSPDVSSGQPAYSPYALLKLYLYGYINRITSSRRLEQETRRNLEVIWLMSELQPAFKTIATFRKDNSKALKNINRQFVLLCDELHLLGKQDFAVDGTFIKANAHKSSIFTRTKLDSQLKKIDKHILEYQQLIDEQDKNEASSEYQSEIKNLNEKLNQLKERQEVKKNLLKQLKTKKQKQISLIDPDARLMTKGGCCEASYNAQIVTDGQNNLIVAEELTQDGNDYNQLVPMARETQKLLQIEEMNIFADSGYYKTQQLIDCKALKITAYVAIRKPSILKNTQDKYQRKDFTYNEDMDCFICPQGKHLKKQGQFYRRNEKLLVRYTAKQSVCAQCPLRLNCLPLNARYKQLNMVSNASEINLMLKEHEERMMQHPDAMKQRGSMVEHPFGTIKIRNGKHQFLTRGIEKCRGEFSLMILSYNFTRVMNIIGLDRFCDFMKNRTNSFESATR